MNERIRQLWEDNDTIEVCYPEQGSPVSVSATTLEKYAQLIVRECLELCQYESEDYDDQFDLGRVHQAKEITHLIKKHFGVEE